MNEQFFTDLTDIATKTPFSKEQLDDFVRKLVRENDPLRVYLHGSYAWGEPDSNSDIDFCVLLPTVEELDGEHDFADVDEYEIDIDVDVYYPSLKLFEEMLSSPATLEYRLYHEGIILYTKPDLVFDHNRPMYRLDEDLIQKASGSLQAAKLLLPNGELMYGWVLFHIQQTYEMALRAYRAFHLHKIHKDHNIRLLRAFCGRIDPEFLEIDGFKPMTRGVSPDATWPDTSQLINFRTWKKSANRSIWRKRYSDLSNKK